ncbi:MAG: electron transfer flavoprotein-ubiquinone oxidoreductase [Pelagibacterales bacterium]|nr:electron transfer flavoprotein-ubiquinone oxidoreductase [Pelagibacterales bacterium]
MHYDVVIVGAGPAGLSAAIKLKQLSSEISVCIIEKGAEVGSHILSGAILEPGSLNELLPNWKELNAPINTRVTKEDFFFLTKNNYVKLPNFILPGEMKNDDNFIISLGNLCKWLGQHAENIGVDIFPGFTAKEIIYNDDGKVTGVLSGEKGVLKNGEKSSQYEPSIALKANQTFFAEGCRGHLGKQLIERFQLYEKNKFQTYAIGIKELWELNDNSLPLGSVIHTIGWPLYNNAYGGSFLYKLTENTVSLGFVVGLDYTNPYLSPYREFQNFKLHPKISSYLKNGKRISYGARALNEGGIQSLPRLSFPGGVMLGCEAGTLNVLKIKGTHTAISSGILAAISYFEAKQEDKHKKELTNYCTNFKRSSVYHELYKVRNVRPGFKYGLFPGLINTFIDQKIFRGKVPWTLSHKKKDNKSLKMKKNSKKISYPKHDNKFSFDLLTNLSFSGTNHKEDQPCHLVLKDKNVPINNNLELFDSPETRYCPANVYEIVESNNSNFSLQINFQNCLHCKTCDIKDPGQNINWVPPEGGDGPNYSGM